MAHWMVAGLVLKSVLVCAWQEDYQRARPLDWSAASDSATHSGSRMVQHSELVWAHSMVAELVQKSVLKWSSQPDQWMEGPLDSLWFVYSATHLGPRIVRYSELVWAHSMVAEVVQ